MNELAAAFPAESYIQSSASEWWKAHEHGELKCYRGSALFGSALFGSAHGQHWTLEKHLLPVANILATAKMPPSKALVSLQVPMMEAVERNLLVVALLASGRAVAGAGWQVGDLKC